MSVRAIPASLYTWQQLLTELLELHPATETKWVIPQLLAIFQRMTPENIYKNLVYLNPLSPVGGMAILYQTQFRQIVGRQDAKQLAVLIQAAHSPEIDANPYLTAEEKRLIGERLRVEMFTYNALVEQKVTGRMLHTPQHQICQADTCRYLAVETAASTSNNMMWVPSKSKTTHQVHCFRLPELLSLLLQGLPNPYTELAFSPELVTLVQQRYPTEIKMMRVTLERTRVEGGGR